MVQNATSRLLAKVGEINKRAMRVKAEVGKQVFEANLSS